MKNDLRLLLLSFLLYLLLACGAGVWLHQWNQSPSNLHKVELQRIQTMAAQGASIQELRAPSYTYVHAIAILDAHEVAANPSFFDQSTTNNQITPLLKHRKVIGWLRIDYSEPKLSTTSLFWFVQGLLALMEIVILGILGYVRNRILRPFHQLQALPQQLAQGHFKAVLKEEKSGYFHAFLQGIGQLKDELDTSAKRRLELEKEKKTLLLSISHDIKTPLHAILLYTKALKEGLYPTAQQQTQALSQIQQKAVSIEHYVEEIMKQSREDILDIKIENQEFYLSALLSSIHQSYQDICAQRGMELQWESKVDALIQGDFTRSIEVVENLLENALKYGDGLVLHLSTQQEEDHFLVRIYNSGPALSPQDLQHVFDSFYRGVQAEGKRGNGLGLYICQSIMRRMGGEIFVQNEEGGVAFYLVFAAA